MAETKKSELEQVKRQLQELAENAAAADRSQVSDAALTMINAINYDDGTLMDASYNSLLASMAEVARDCIPRELEVADGTKKGIMEGWRKFVDKKAYGIAVLDELKDLLESIIDERLASMLKLRKLVNFLTKEEYPVDNSQALEDGIRDLRGFRDDILKGWPSHKPPLPINRDTIAEAREAIRRGEKGMRKEDMVWRDKPT